MITIYVKAYFTGVNLLIHYKVQMFLYCTDMEHTKHTECNVAFPLQQKLRERVTMARYKYTAYWSACREHSISSYFIPFHPIMCNSCMLLML
jgi:hypothetical protein